MKSCFCQNVKSIPHPLSSSTAGVSTWALLVFFTTRPTQGLTEVMSGTLWVSLQYTQRPSPSGCSLHQQYICSGLSLREHSWCILAKGGVSKPGAFRIVLYREKYMLCVTSDQLHRCTSLCLDNISTLSMDSSSNPPHICS